MNQPQDLLPEQENTYRTGATAPPKSRRGLMAVLLMIIILLLGLITLLGVTNHRLFQQLISGGETLGIAFLDHGPAVSAPQATDPSSETVRISAQPVQVLPEDAALSLADRAAESLVTVSCADREGGSVGTGIVLSEDGYVLTLAQVVQNTQSIHIRLSGDRVLSAELVGIDAESGLAVLQTTAGELPPAQFYDASSLRVGDQLYAMAHNAGAEDRFGPTLLATIQTGQDAPELFTLSAGLEKRFIGSPLIDEYGQLVGICLADRDGQSIAISSNSAIGVVNRIIRDSKNENGLNYGILGEDVPAFYQVYYEMPYGMHIVEVYEGSLAQRAGLRPGDIILSVNGIRVTGAMDCKELLLKNLSAPAVNLIVFRNGGRYSLSIQNGD